MRPQRFAGVIIAWLLSSTSMIAQLPAALVVVRGQVFQQSTNESFEPMQSVGIEIPGHTILRSDEDGSFEVKLPHRNQNFTINLIHPNYKVIKPKGGTIVLRGLPIRDTTIHVQIIVLQVEDSTTTRRLQQVKDQLSRLERKNTLSQRQLNRMNQVFADTLTHFRTLREEHRGRIISLEKELIDNKDLQERERETFQGELASYQGQLEELEDSLTTTLDELLVALEEEYLRQNAFYAEITESLDGFTSLIKDFRAYLARIDQVLLHQETSQHFAEVVTDYNRSYELMNTQTLSHVEAVGHYWSNPLAKDMQNLYSLALDQIHGEVVLPLNQEDQALGLWNAAGRGQRPKLKKAKRSANEALARLDPLIAQLERDRLEFLDQLGKF